MFSLRAANRAILPVLWRDPSWRHSVSNCSPTTSRHAQPEAGIIGVARSGAVIMRPLSGPAGSSRGLRRLARWRGYVFAGCGLHQDRAERLVLAQLKVCLARQLKRTEQRGGHCTLHHTYWFRLRRLGVNPASVLWRDPELGRQMPDNRQGEIVGKSLPPIGQAALQARACRHPAGPTATPNPRHQASRSSADHDGCIAPLRLRSVRPGSRIGLRQPTWPKRAASRSLAWSSKSPPDLTLATKGCTTIK